MNELWGTVRPFLMVIVLYQLFKSLLDCFWRRG